MERTQIDRVIEKLKLESAISPELIVNDFDRRELIKVLEKIFEENRPILKDKENSVLLTNFLRIVSFLINQGRLKVTETYMKGETFSNEFYQNMLAFLSEVDEET